MDKRGNLHRQLLRWFQTHQRNLPWRKTRNPYAILVSEIMLQQTQVDRVAPKYRAFLKRFPSLAALARSRQASVVRSWAGLGYNRRARHLHQLARIVMAEHGGQLPRAPEVLRRLPGIGPYTAAAVACFAFGAPVALVDVNVRRVLGRYFFGTRGPQKVSEKKLWELAGSVVPAGQSVQWNSALMDFGAIVCTHRQPSCHTCPLRSQCKAYPAILKTAPTVKTTPAFAGSRRYWRGRIIARLREQALSYETLQRELADQGLPERAFIAILATLRAEQLVHVWRGRVSL